MRLNLNNPELGLTTVVEVGFRHYRYYENSDGVVDTRTERVDFNDNCRMVRTEATECVLTFTTLDIKNQIQSRFEVNGWSFCSPNDFFNKEIGRKSSLGRALRGFEDEFRENIWLIYNTRTFNRASNFVKYHFTNLRYDENYYADFTSTNNIIVEDKILTPKEFYSLFNNVKETV